MHSKYSLLFLLTQFVLLSLYAQRDDGIQYIKNAGSTSGSFEKITYYKTQKLPFRNIIVLDKRFDSSKTGYANVGLFQSNHAKIILKDSWTATLNNYFSRNLDSASGHSLVIILRSFWLQKGTIDQLVNKKVVKRPMTGSIDEGGYVTSALDVYVQNDSSLWGLFKIDTSFINLASNYNKNRLEDFFFLPFDSIARRISTMPVPDVLATRRKLSWEEVNTYYDKRFDLPVLKDTGIKKGIFLRFDDFKNNKPMEGPFKFVNGKVTDELYIVSKDHEELVSKYWGFFDGNSLYIQTGLSAFKAIRQQDTFELYGAKQVTNYHNNGRQNDFNVSGYSVDKKILQVNMSTGKIY